MVQSAQSWSYLRDFMGVKFITPQLEVNIWPLPINWRHRGHYTLQISVLVLSIHCEAMQDCQALFLFLNQILEYRQLINICIRANESIYSPKLQFFVRTRFRILLQCNPEGRTRVCPWTPAFDKDNQHTEFHSSCTLTLVLLPENSIRLQMQEVLSEKNMQS